MKKGHRPIRMCIICRQRFYKDSLNRYVLVNGKFVLDSKKRLPGRGFYVCNSSECLRKIQKKLKNNF